MDTILYYGSEKGLSYNLRLRTNIVSSTLLCINQFGEQRILLCFLGLEAENKAMNKYIVCDFARGNWGKSNTLLEVIEQLKEKTSLIVEEQIGDKDKYAVFDMNKKRIVVNTQGDPDSYQEEGLQRAVKEDAAIIVCASRTRGTTVKCIYEVAKHGYEVIWFSNIFADSEDLPCVTDFPEIMADSIVKLIQKL